MATTTFSLRMDAQLKRESEAIFSELGLNLTTAINAFLRQAVRVGGLPFDLKVPEPTRETILAMIEADALLEDPDAPRYDVEDALRELRS